ncbi:MAG: histidinol-phosphate transaminase [Oscillospiraceae bacterium]|nr:histidinol-phosphate transaminase [Oscillospiraceae bacterium]
MSRFFSGKYDALTPYTPGEQPRGQTFIKLNTNESPYPPAPLAQQYAKKEAEKLNLYSDPQCRDLMAMAAEKLGVREDQILFTNGSDEVLNFAFMAFCDAAHPAVFPDITYGFYPVFARLNGVPYTEIPLQEDFSVCVEDYIGLNQTIFLANPNAPTGICLPLSDIERIVAGNPDSVVVIDEAYIDFGGESAMALIPKYDNLLVVQTFSKSRSMAGARLGFGAGNAALIRDLNTIRYSTNPYNINRMTMAAGVGALEADGYFQVNCRRIVETREWTGEKLSALGFLVIPSMTNFVFVKHPEVPGRDLYLALREKGILVRHFDTPKLTDYNRITIGSREQMKALVAALNEILEVAP